MQYALLIYDEEATWQGMDEAQRGQIFQAYGAYTQELRDAGALVGGEALQPTTTATTVQVDGGETLTTDGPFAETKEQLGGFYIIDVASLDDALAWAAKIPSASVGGKIEVRPLLQFDSNEAGQG